jgi:NADPH-dependent glutamate synthase beta subunit-like oxidoreductase
VITAAELLKIPVFAGKRVFVIGGGNSAGQAAVFFSNYAAEVTMLVRGTGLALSMSRYLITQIAEKDNIRIEAFTEVTAVQGEEHLEQIVTTTRHSDGGHTSTTRDADALFLMIGATAEHGMASTDAGARRQWLYLYRKRPDRMVSRTRAVSPGDQPSRHILCGRRASRFDQTRSERRRQRQHVDCIHPSIPGAHRQSRSYALIT